MGRYASEISARIIAKQDDHSYLLNPAWASYDVDSVPGIEVVSDVRKILSQTALFSFRVALKLVHQ